MKCKFQKKLSSSLDPSNRNKDMISVTSPKTKYKVNNVNLNSHGILPIRQYLAFIMDMKKCEENLWASLKKKKREKSFALSLRDQEKETKLNIEEVRKKNNRQDIRR